MSLDAMTVSKVSVIIPTYNRARFVVEAIASVSAQTFEDLEILVVDDGSDDDTLEVVGQVAGPVRLIARPHTGLPAAVRNAGIAQANGEYIALLDSDDRWLPHKLRRQVDLLDRAADVGLTCGNAIIAGEHRTYLDTRVAERTEAIAPGGSFRALLEENFVIASTAVFRRSLLERTEWFDEDPRLRAAEDYDLWLRIAAISEIHYDPEPLAIYRDAVSESIRGEQSTTAAMESLLLTGRRAIRFATSNGAATGDTPLVAQRLERRRRRELARVLWSERRYVASIRARVGLST